MNFAIEINELNDLGFTSNDLRWLIAKGHLSHACEINAVTNESRSFKDSHQSRFTADSCFVLPELGVQFVRLGLLEPWRAADPQGVKQIEPLRAELAVHTYRVEPAGRQLHAQLPSVRQYRLGTADLERCRLAVVGVEVNLGEAIGLVPRREFVPRHAMGGLRAQRRTAVGTDPLEPRRVFAESVSPRCASRHVAARRLLRQV